MEFTAKFEPFTSPRAPFLGDPRHDESVRFCEAEWHDTHTCPNTSSLLWSSSVLNPRNRVDSLPIPSEAKWRIDGCAAMGRMFFPIPKYMIPDLPVKYINVLIPCQSQHPPALRRGLRSTEAIFASGIEIGSLEISRYLIQALESWSSRLPYFDEIYRNIAFGSLIVLEKLLFQPKLSNLRFIARTDLSRDLRKLDDLTAQWGLPPRIWPQILPVSQLRLVKQISQTVSIVRLPDAISEKQFVFKTNLNNMNRIYHELKVLMTMPSHKNIIRRPQYLVSYHEMSGTSALILGFVLEYVQWQTLGDILDSHASVPLSLKLSWSTQLITALIHILGSPAKFYSDLKPDNILVCSHGEGRILIIDLEQGGNWDTFCAPEILFTSWMKRLATDDAVPKLKREEYKSLLSMILPAQTEMTETYSNPPYGYYDEWTNITPEMQEAAMVYAAGKVLWCIFEGFSHTTNTLEEKYAKRVAVEFPTFRNTPEELRSLIKCCTLGAPEFVPKMVKIQRHGAHFFAQSYDESEQCLSENTPIETLLSFQNYIDSRLLEMEIYERAKVRWLKGSCRPEDMRVLRFPERPSLEEMLRCLQQYAGICLASMKS